ncbi:MAG: ATP-dependent DNA helicase, partial [Alphaproteobacteria bacterium]
MARADAEPVYLSVGHAACGVATGDGVRRIDPAEVRPLLVVGLAAIPAPVVVCHRPTAIARLGQDAGRALDILELYAFARPADPVIPSPRGIAAALGLAVPITIEQEAATLRDATRVLLARLAGSRNPEWPGIAAVMGRGGWGWAALLPALPPDDPRLRRGLDALAVWRRLPVWEFEGPDDPPGDLGVTADDARRRLAELLDERSEPRPQQAAYASAVSAAFQPRHEQGDATVVIAEAGTGTGKTLGYVAPASLWAERNGAPVWISTFTRNLQRQIGQELVHLYPDEKERAQKVVTRKGRENYLCLLSFEEAVASVAASPANAVALGLMARWAAATQEGDMVGGDLPGWLPALLGRGRILGLADRRGECIYSACPHYGRCFIERSVRKARKAELVIANHALVLAQAALGGIDDGRLPTRLVFDEGHHLYDAADSVFAAYLSGQETAEMRRWLRGGDTARSRGRMRGLLNRYGELTVDDAEAEAALQQAMAAALALPGEGWQNRLREGQPEGPAELFLAHVREQVYARADSEGPYSLECDLRPVSEPMARTAALLDSALEDLARPLKRLAARFLRKLDEEADTLDSSTRNRLEAGIRALARRAEMTIPGWRGLLQSIDRDPPPAFVDWLTVERIDGRDIDLGARRHWIDPTIPLAEHVLGQAHGAVVTSATLTDGSGDLQRDWAAAEARTGAIHLATAAIRAQVTSPFDYPAQTRVFIVTDVGRNGPDQVAAAYRTLFLASGGGALGLFTAISRLRAVHSRIAAPLAEAGLPLYAQHVDPMDPATLVDMFRAETDACLLGTDAVRDGVDVPGRSLRLVVFDRVPWARPSILHRVRREAYEAAGGDRRDFDDIATRLRLKQAFGRLVRRADDRGVFVLLDGRTP